MRWVRAHKLLLIIFSASFVLAGIELMGGSTEDGKPSDYLEADYNIADVSTEIYPERALSFYYQAQQAAYCNEPGSRQFEVCRSRGPAEPGEIRGLLEAALATGNRSIEEAMYNYAWVLVQEDAPSDEIDAAVETWRRAIRDRIARILARCAGRGDRAPRTGNAQREDATR